MPGTSNFGFLEGHDVRLATFGAQAERYFRDDPPTAIVKLRQFAELLAKLVAAHHALYLGERETFDEPNSNVGWRALEANRAAAYFRSWQGMPIKWRGTSRRPIPDNRHSSDQRSSPFHLAYNRNAEHPVNAILNYAYTGLQSELRIKATADGYDPTIGVLHERRDGSSKFVFDLMEPERPVHKPAKANKGRSALSANHFGVLRGLVSAYSQKEVAGTMQRFCLPSQPRQCGLPTLRMLVIGAPPN